MKTAISLPDELFAEAEALALQLETSRSQLYAAALREFLARHQPDGVTAALDVVYESEPSNVDPALAAAAARVLERTEW